MKLEEGAFQAYRRGEFIEDENGVIYQKDFLRGSHAKMVDTALGEFKIINTGKVTHWQPIPKPPEEEHE